MLSVLNVLVESLYMQKKEKKPILLLGAGCSKASGCFTTKELIVKLNKEKKLSIPPDKMNLKELKEKLRRDAFSLSLAEVFSKSTPSEGYWFLATLIKRGYFDLILTTNYDTCLEKILALTMSYDDFKVMARGEIEDNSIDALIRDSLQRIKIVKLHGDYQSKRMIVEPSEVWDIKTPLKETLQRLIEDRGIIIVGSSLSDSYMLNILKKDENERYWYINFEYPTAGSITRQNLDSIKIKDNHIISSDEGDFDNFFSLLTLKLSEKEHEGSEDIKKMQMELSNNKNVERLISSCKIEIDRRTLDDLINELKNIIERWCPRINNLVFVHDPEAPGGTEIYKILKANFANWISEKRCFKLFVSGRGAEMYQRDAKDFLGIDGREVDLEALNADSKFLLIDSVSFTGGTIKKAQYKLVQLFGDKIEVRAAVIYTGRELEKELVNNKFGIENVHFYKVDKINSHQILFPWGWTSSTVPILPDEGELGELKIINEFIPNRYFSFLPRPWGSIFSMVDNENVSIKILEIKPHEKTSQHKHYLRDEMFYILDEHIILQIWDENILLRRGISFRVPAGVIHRLIGLDIPCRVLEISYNYNNQVEDIKRYDDNYGRIHKKGDV